MAKYNVHGGHNPANKIACGAADILDESLEDRLVCKAVIKYLKAAGHTTYNCTVDNGTSQRDVLQKICAKCNAHDVTLDVSIHFNSGRNKHKSNGKPGGFEIWATNYTGIKKEASARIIANLKKLGMNTHGDPYKTTSNLYYLNHTNAKAILVEVEFVDDKDSANIYKKIGYDKIGKAIAEGIIGKSINSKKVTVKPKTSSSFKSYKVKVTASALNVRKSPSTTAAIARDAYKKGRTVTIKAIKNGWGKTKDGWIKLSYTKKC